MPLAQQETKRSLVITSIAADNHPVLKHYASECSSKGIDFIVMGDVISPNNFQLEGCQFYSIAQQEALPYTLSAILPKRHYARKNLGYLEAIRQGATLIQETDDDNWPLADFWAEKTAKVEAKSLYAQDWVNLYNYFSAEKTWARGFPLERIHSSPNPEMGVLENHYCPIQQGLADENPDVDAVYRLTAKLPIFFEKNIRIAAGKGLLHPFNSQNTVWFPEAYSLLYLPSYCSFRMTDIWRSYVALRIAYANGWHILFESPSVWQERNAHNLLRDFKDEVEGYLHNAKICETLFALSLKAGAAHLADNLLLCYEAFIRLNLVDAKEIQLIEAWNADLIKLTH